MKNWKTTAAGILSAFIGSAGPLAAYLAANGGPTNGAKIAGAVTCAAIIARVWVGLLQNDAPAVNAAQTITPAPDAGKP